MDRTPSINTREYPGTVQSIFRRVWTGWPCFVSISVVVRANNYPSTVQCEERDNGSQDYDHRGVPIYLLPFRSPWIESDPASDFRRILTYPGSAHPPTWLLPNTRDFNVNRAYKRTRGRRGKHRIKQPTCQPRTQESAFAPP